MKKYLILMSMAAAGVAFAASGSRDKDNPTLISSWTDNLTGQIIWRGEGKGVADLTTMTDLYVKADGNYTIGNFTTSGTGGNHTNMHLDLDKRRTPRVQRRLGNNPDSPFIRGGLLS